jgi:hypothetical protein
MRAGGCREDGDVVTMGGQKTAEVIGYALHTSSAGIVVLRDDKKYFQDKFQLYIFLKSKMTGNSSSQTRWQGIAHFPP